MLVRGSPRGELSVRRISSGCGGGDPAAQEGRAAGVLGERSGACNRIGESLVGARGIWIAVNGGRAVGPGSRQGRVWTLVQRRKSRRSAWLWGWSSERLAREARWSPWPPVSPGSRAGEPLVPVPRAERAAGVGACASPSFVASDFPSLVGGAVADRGRREDEAEAGWSGSVGAVGQAVDLGRDPSFGFSFAELAARPPVPEPLVVGRARVSPLLSARGERSSPYKCWWWIQKAESTLVLGFPAAPRDIQR